MAYRFIIADSPELRRMPWEKIEEEGLTRAILWNRLHPTLLDWLELVSPSTTLMGSAFDDEKGGELAGALWVVPSGLCGTVHFVIFKEWRADKGALGARLCAGFSRRGRLKPCLLRSRPVIGIYGHSWTLWASRRGLSAFRKPATCPRRAIKHAAKIWRWPSCAVMKRGNYGRCSQWNFWRWEVFPLSRHIRG